MRKDLKIGMAIGAVLLVLLIVYLAVPKSGDGDVAQNTELTEGQPADGENAPAEGGTDPADAAPAGAETGGAQVAAAGDKRETPAGQGDDPFAANAGGADARPTASTGAATNWATLLETGEMPLRTMTPSLSASKTEPPAAGGAPAPQEPAAPSDALAQAASDVTSGSTSGTAATPTTTNADPEPARTSAKTSDAPSNRATTASGNARTHRVAKGETFAKIAENLLGDERYYLEIEKANPDVDPTRIRPGMVINLPDVSAAKRSSDDRAVTASGRQERELDPEKEYKVRPGESLYVIAKRIYHNSAKVDEIYELNKGVIGDDPAKLKAGMVLKLPPKGEAETSESR